MYDANQYVHIGYYDKTKACIHFNGYYGLDFYLKGQAIVALHMMDGKWKYSTILESKPEVGSQIIKKTFETVYTKETALTVCENKATGRLYVE